MLIRGATVHPRNATERRRGYGDRRREQPKPVVNRHWTRKLRAVVCVIGASIVCCCCVRSTDPGCDDGKGGGNQPIVDQFDLPYQRSAQRRRAHKWRTGATADGRRYAALRATVRHHRSVQAGRSGWAAWCHHSRPDADPGDQAVVLVRQDAPAQRARPRHVPLPDSVLPDGADEHVRPDADLDRRDRGERELHDEHVLQPGRGPVHRGDAERAHQGERVAGRRAGRDASHEGHRAGHCVRRYGDGLPEPRLHGQHLPERGQLGVQPGVRHDEAVHAVRGVHEDPRGGRQPDAEHHGRERDHAAELDRPARHGDRRDAHARPQQGARPVPRAGLQQHGRHLRHADDAHLDHGRLELLPVRRHLRHDAEQLGHARDARGDPAHRRLDPVGGIGGARNAFARGPRPVHRGAHSRRVSGGAAVGSAQKAEAEGRPAGAGQHPGALRRCRHVRLHHRGGGQHPAESAALPADGRDRESAPDTHPGEAGLHQHGGAGAEVRPRVRAARYGDRFPGFRTMRNVRRRADKHSAI